MSRGTDYTSNILILFTFLSRQNFGKQFYLFLSHYCTVARYRQNGQHLIFRVFHVRNEKSAIGLPLHQTKFLSPPPLSAFDLLQTPTI